MTGLVVDTSILISILQDEPEAVPFAGAVLEARLRLVSAASMLEAYCVVLRGRYADGSSRLSVLASDLALDVIPFNEAQLASAIEAYRIFGRGTGHRANLNMGDCFAYALAKTRNLPLLFKGDDFIHTDIRPVLA